MCSGFVSTMIFRTSLVFIPERTCLYESGSACRRLTSISRIFGDLTSSRSFINPENRGRYIICLNNVCVPMTQDKKEKFISEDYRMSTRGRDVCSAIFRRNYQVGRLMARKPVNRAIRRNQYSPAPK